MVLFQSLLSWEIYRKMKSFDLQISSHSASNVSFDTERQLFPRESFNRVKQVSNNKNINDNRIGLFLIIIGGLNTQITNPFRKMDIMHSMQVEINFLN